MGGDVKDQQINGFDLLLAKVQIGNFFSTLQVIQDWMDAVACGEAGHRFPDPLWRDDDYPCKPPLTQEIADGLIQDLGDAASVLAELSPTARLAFGQSIYRVLSVESEVQSEAIVQAVELGFNMPPTRPQVQYSIAKILR